MMTATQIESFLQAVAIGHKCPLFSCQLFCAVVANSQFSCVQFGVHQPVSEYRLELLHAGQLPGQTRSRKPLPYEESIRVQHLYCQPISVLHASDVDRCAISDLCSHLDHSPSIATDATTNSQSETSLSGSFRQANALLWNYLHASAGRNPCLSEIRSVCPTSASHVDTSSLLPVAPISARSLC